MIYEGRGSCTAIRNGKCLLPADLKHNKVNPDKLRLKVNPLEKHQEKVNVSRKQRIKSRY